MGQDWWEYDDSSFQRILTVTHEQLEGIDWLIQRLQRIQVTDYGPAKSGAMVPGLDPSQKAGWTLARAYGKGIFTESGAEYDGQQYWITTQPLYQNVVKWFLTKFPKDPDGEPELPDWIDDTYSLIDQFATQLLSTDYERVAATEADWPDFFETAVRAPNWDDFINIVQPELEEAFAGTGPRWSSVRARAVQEAIRKWTMDINANRSKYAFDWLGRVKDYREKMIDRSVMIQEKVGKTNAELYDKMLDRRTKAWLDGQTRKAQVYLGLIKELSSSLMDMAKYLMGVPSQEFLQRSMVLMQSGELERGVDGQKELVKFQNWLRTQDEMSPVIEYMAAVCGQPLYTAVATQEADNPWGDVIQGAFGFLGSFAQGALKDII